MDSWKWPDTLIEIGVILLVMVVAWQVAVVATKRLVASALKRQQDNRGSLGKAGQWLGLDSPRQVKRTRTLGSMLTSVAAFAIVLVGSLMILSTLGLPMGPLLTSAGIGGIALGFGAQSLVKDFLSGIFLIAEDQFGVGDVVDLGEVSGTVEDVGLRITKVRDPGGKVWYVRNGEIIRVGNVSQGWSNALVDIPVDYRSNPQEVISIITQVLEGIEEDDSLKDALLESPQVLGVESIQSTTMTIRILAKCAANQQWGVMREIRERSKVALDAAGIQGPSAPWSQQ
ncbi:mechanosensitive ion channel family protein [Aestuariimicrobium sp. p3-SID1156]|uniref:mechanosensitive ion channel family protein n=1 Tax=Aestuariimicrobium sp. p3-SID1156 TaxID=2916038 RepID=UPI00223AFD60|nr:mechanosensitive ion channel family protein [Aestuariimicrobium sp. p3-SID1156]MCT1458089.1 mechanosensitive ion channel family protein [Aestuariimicrobium sp. p3-SID1156]